MEDHELVTRFESLGYGCEFGVFQRFCAAEPLGLFRFSASKMENLRAVIAGGLAFFDAEDLKFRPASGDEEYMGYSARYDDFDYHTFAVQSQVAEGVVRARELRKLRYLRSAFASVLGNNEKIMLRTGHATHDEIDRLSELLRLRGTRWLLWVEQADEGHAPGTVDRLKDGLLKGYLAHFATFHDEPRIDVQSWIRVCRTAYDVVEREEGREPPARRAAKGIEIEDAWRRGTYARTTYPDPRTRPSAASSCLLISPAITPKDALVEASIEHALPSRTLLVFSVWVFVPGDFRGFLIEARMSGAKPLHRRKVDLSKRDVWQQVWCAGRTTRDATRLAMSLNVAADAGSTLYAAGWQLETGSIPSERLSAAESGDRGGQRFALMTLRRLRLRMADALIRRGKHRRADRLIERGLSLYPHDLAFYFSYARNASAGGDWTASVDRWTFATRAAFGIADCHRMLALSLRKTENPTRAAAIIDGALRLFPDDFAIRAEAATLAEVCGHHAEAARLRATMHRREPPTSTADPRPRPAETAEAAQ